MTLLILWIYFLVAHIYKTSCNQVSSSQATGYFPLGRNWPFQRNERRFQTYGADCSDNEDDDTAEQMNVDKERRQVLWDMVLEEVDNDLPKCRATILELSNPNIFVLLTLKIEVLNDLIFLDYFTENNNYAFTYLANTLHQLAIGGQKQTTAPHMELPFNLDLLQYWKDLLSNVGDFMHPQNVFTFFRYHLDTNNKYGVPTRTLHTFEFCLPLHVIFFLLRDARADPCPDSTPFGKNSQQGFLSSWLITCALVSKK